MFFKGFDYDIKVILKQMQQKCLVKGAFWLVSSDAKANFKCHLASVCTAVAVSATGGAGLDIRATSCMLSNNFSKEEVEAVSAPNTSKEKNKGEIKTQC